jgi:hypothetical protein
VIAAGHGWGLAVFPAAAAVVAFVFAVRLAGRYVRRHRPHEGAWLVALVMFAVASGAMADGVARGWGPADFRLYWLFGAVLNVPFLFAGEVYLLARRRGLAHAVMAVIVAAAAYATVVVMTADLDASRLRTALPLGKDVFGQTLAHGLAQLYGNAAYFLLLGGLLWSAWRLKGRPELKSQLVGVLLIAVGTSVVAVGSGIGAAFHLVALFSVSLAAGVAIIFAGFVAASRPPHRTEVVGPPD